MADFQRLHNVYSNDEVRFIDEISCYLLEQGFFLTLINGGKAPVTLKLSEKNKSGIQSNILGNLSVPAHDVVVAYLNRERLFSIIFEHDKLVINRPEKDIIFSKYGNKANASDVISNIIVHQEDYSDIILSAAKHASKNFEIRPKLAEVLSDKGVKDIKSSFVSRNENSACVYRVAKMIEDYEKSKTQGSIHLIEKGELNEVVKYVTSNGYSVFLLEDDFMKPINNEEDLEGTSGNCYAVVRSDGGVVGFLKALVKKNVGIRAKFKVSVLNNIWNSDLDIRSILEPKKILESKKNPNATEQSSCDMGDGEKTEFLDRTAWKIARFINIAAETIAKRMLKGEYCDDIDANLSMDFFETSRRYGYSNDFMLSFIYASIMNSIKEKGVFSLYGMYDIVKNTEFNKEGDSFIRLANNENLKKMFDDYHKSNFVLPQKHYEKVVTFYDRILSKTLSSIYALDLNLSYLEQFSNDNNNDEVTKTFLNKCFDKNSKETFKKDDANPSSKREILPSPMKDIKLNRIYIDSLTKEENKYIDDISDHITDIIMDFDAGFSEFNSPYKATSYPFAFPFDIYYKVGGIDREHMKLFVSGLILSTIEGIKYNGGCEPKSKIGPYASLLDAMTYNDYGIFESNSLDKIEANPFTKEFFRVIVSRHALSRGETHELSIAYCKHLYTILEKLKKLDDDREPLIKLVDKSRPFFDVLFDEHKEDDVQSPSNSGTTSKSDDSLTAEEIINRDSGWIETLINGLVTRTMRLIPDNKDGEFGYKENNDIYSKEEQRLDDLYRKVGGVSYYGFTLYLKAIFYETVITRKAFSRSELCKFIERGDFNIHTKDNEALTGFLRYINGKMLSDEEKNDVMSLYRKKASYVFDHLLDNAFNFGSRFTELGDNLKRNPAYAAAFIEKNKGE